MENYKNKELKMVLWYLDKLKNLLEFLICKLQLEVTSILQMLMICMEFPKEILIEKGLYFLGPFSIINYSPSSIHSTLVPIIDIMLIS